MYSFTAIDFETAHSQSHSICQVGLVRVEQNVIVKEITQLIQPPRNYYWSSFIDIHGISPSDTAFAPRFDQFWPELEPYIKNQNVVAHNIAFDHNCLMGTLDYYFIPRPNYKKHCTYKIYKSGLRKLATQHQIPLKHHDALSDAYACAILFLKHLLKQGSRLV